MSTNTPTESEMDRMQTMSVGDERLWAHVGMAACKVFSQFSLDQLEAFSDDPGLQGMRAADANAERARELGDGAKVMVDQNREWGERAVQGVVNSGYKPMSQELIGQVQEMITGGEPRLAAKVELRDPFQTIIDRNYRNQPGFPAMADSLAALAELPGSGLPGREELAKQLHEASYKKLQDMLAHAGIGRGLSKGQPDFTSDWKTERVAVQYATASVVADFANKAAARLEMSNPDGLAASRSAQSILAAVNDKARTQAWELFTSSAGLTPGFVAQVSQGYHPSASLGEDLVGYMAGRAQQIANIPERTPEIRYGLTPEQRYTALGQMQPMMRLLSNVGDPEHHALFNAALDGARMKAPGVSLPEGPRIGTDPRPYDDDLDPAEIIDPDVARAAGRARAVIDEPEVAEFKRSRGLDKPSTPDI